MTEIIRDTETTGAVLEVEGVSQRYGAKTALDDVSMHVDSGELVGVLGVNGAGKTTLLESIIGARPLLRGAFEWQVWTWAEAVTARPRT